MAGLGGVLCRMCMGIGVSMEIIMLIEVCINESCIVTSGYRSTFKSQ